MHCVRQQRKQKHRTWPKRDKGTNSRWRRGPGTRPMSEPILLFVQGKCTEKDYFKLLKRRLSLSSLTIRTESQSPENLIKQTKTTISRDKNAPFSAIYYVVMLMTLVMSSSVKHSRQQKMQLIAKPNTILWCLMKALKPGF